MGLAVLSRAPLSLLLLLLLAAVPIYLAQEHVPEVDQRSEAADPEATLPFNEKELEQAIRDMLAGYNILPLPGLPILSIDGDSVSITLSLADVYLQGLADIDPIISMINFNTVKLGLLFHEISFYAGTYSSNGHILNLPFHGEGPMYLRLHDLSLAFTIQFSLKPCVIDNTTALEFDLGRMETRFENLNQDEGADLGQLVDIVLPSFGPDIIKQLQVILSTKYYQFFDNIIVGLINNVLNCTTQPMEDILKTDELLMVMDGIVKDLIP